MSKRDNQVQFYHMDQLGAAADDRSQTLSRPFHARTLPWVDGGPGVPGDVQLWLLPDDVDGVPPGIRYGFQELSSDEVTVGTLAYSFWSNPAQRLRSMLLYSKGVATSRETIDWLGPTTFYDMWGVGGSSGSTLLSPEHYNRIVGTTQGGLAGLGGAWRAAPNASNFLREYDADRNQVLDAIEYDWLTSKPLQNFYFFSFTAGLELARWVVVPHGSAHSVTARGYYLDGAPVMEGTDSKSDGCWEQFARFRPRAVLRITVRASGEQQSASSPGSYIKFRADASGHEVRYDFRPGFQPALHAGQLELENFADYRLILGTHPGTNVKIESLSIAVDRQPLGWGTHDERRSWQYGKNAFPVAWGVRTNIGFSGAVVGPEPHPFCLRNSYLGLVPGNSYRIRFQSVGRRWPASGAAISCLLLMQGTDDLQNFVHRWALPLSSGPIEQDIEVAVPSGAVGPLFFYSENEGAFLINNIEIARVQSWKFC